MNRYVNQVLLAILDVIFVNAAIFAGYFARFQWNIPGAYLHIYYKSFIPITLIMLLCFWFFRLYKSVWRYASIIELMYTIMAVTLGSLGSLLYGILVGYRLPISVYFIMWALIMVASGGIRLISRVIASIDIIPNSIIKQNKRVIVIGAGDAGAMVVKEMKKHPELGYSPVALIDDDKTKIGGLINGTPIIGTRNDIGDIVKNRDIDEILIALPSINNHERREIMKICSATGVKLKTLPGIYELINGKISINQIRDVEIEDLLGRDPIELNIEGIAGYLSDKVVLITGGGGSIGSELCRQIVKFGPKKLIVLDIYENGAYDLQMELNFKYPEVSKEVVIASIREKERLEEVFERFKPDVVFHAAAHKHVPLMEANPKEAIKNNVIGTLNLAKTADKYNVKKFVLISTDKAVNPTNIMGATKRMCEMVIQSIDKISKTEFVAVRFGNVLGSNGSVIPLFKKQIKQGGPITVTHPDINRYFMTIPEAAQLVIQAGSMAKGGEIFILDMGSPVKIVDLAEDLIRLSGLEPGKDIKIKFTGLRPGEKLYEELLMDEEGITNTNHKKIFIGKPGHYSFDDINIKVDSLRNILDKDDEKIFELVEEIVPTYSRKK
ncbi:nucleoside-diphosphate sugar epimerase/dehydratase [Clostridium cylindrosporum]|uniref:Capsular polysaccharide biosynthesis protein CapD n=1 Tax=Clostridium cylindrosporum DSM 605 TaxID=1121307 RepID=A0A0J8D9V0_CLOCY|nr:nucleoside-diphosphate sugar epimerase/dehydratase [Clostridium cylindrosporum]KMT22617.1 capsular polysaccharide biosynthesis protein CapD [Clostridium cylindrosporum DSM 605]